MFDYSPASPDSIHRAKQLKTVCDHYGVELAHAAVAFPLREKAVATVLLGARDRNELQQCLAMNLDDVPDELWTELTNQGLIHELDD